MTSINRKEKKIIKLLGLCFFLKLFITLLSVISCNQFNQLYLSKFFHLKRNLTKNIKVKGFKDS